MHLVWAYVVTFLWGLSALTTKYAVTHRHRPMSAITTSALMYLGAVAAFVVTVVWFDRASLGVISRDVRTCSPALVACVVVSGCLSMYIAGIMYGNLLKHHPASVISAITSASPLVVLVGAYLLMRDDAPVSKPLWAAGGVVLTVMGLVLLALATSQHTARFR